MPTFLARRYARKLDAVGRTERAVGTFILLLVVGIVAAYAVQVATDRDYLFNVGAPDYRAADARRGAWPEPIEEFAPEPVARSDGSAREVENPFPDPDLPGWRTPVRVERFDAENLFAKIDGRADLYLQHGVAGLTFGAYTHADGDHTIDVYWYDMGQAEQAAAIFRAEQDAEAPRVRVGEEAYQVGGAVFLRKGSSYVQVLPSRLDEDAGAALRIAEQIAGSIGE